MSYPRRLAKKVTTKLTIPSDGSNSTSLTLADFKLGSKIEALVNISVLREDPNVANVYAPEGRINAAGDAVGLTLFSGTGTTLTAEVVVIGY